MAKLTFVYSSMGAGKSLQLLTRNHMLTHRGFKTALLKPSTDDRSEGIFSRLGHSAPCLLIDRGILPSTLVLVAGNTKPDYILVDEAQFLDEKQVMDLANLVDNWGIDVTCYGLKLTWQGNFFDGSLALMKHADELQQVETLCKRNIGSPAMYHIKNGGLDSTIETGYEDLYESVSRKVWLEWKESLDNENRDEPTPCGGD